MLCVMGDPQVLPPFVYYLSIMSPMSDELWRVNWPPICGPFLLSASICRLIDNNFPIILDLDLAGTNRCALRMLVRSPDIPDGLGQHGRIAPLQPVKSAGIVMTQNRQSRQKTRDIWIHTVGRGLNRWRWQSLAGRTIVPGSTTQYSRRRLVEEEEESPVHGNR